MYKVEKVRIDGFWGRMRVQCRFGGDVNLIIGMNGTGKTTFMNILYSTLTANFDELSENEFESVEIGLIDGQSRKSIRLVRIDDETSPYQMYEYSVSRKKYKIRYFATNERGHPPSVRRRAQIESEDLRTLLSELVSLSSISVYRLRSSDEYEIRERHRTIVVSPVDYRLGNLLRQLTQFQLQLTQRVRDVSQNLQRKVLASILYSKEDKDAGVYSLEFDKAVERRNLMAAYTQLNAVDARTREKIEFHVDTIENTVSKLKSSSEGLLESADAKVDFGSLDAWKKTQRIIQMSLEAEEDISKIFSQLNLFISTVESFISDKKFTFESGNLIVKNEYGAIDHARLSSGEKQLLILFIEALLQRKKQHVYLADEPEISLHVDWQRRIIPAVKELNPEAQVIAATHSPEIASEYPENLIDMQDMVTDAD